MRILRTDDVVERTGLSRTTIWRWERRGDFPGRRRIGGTTVGWLESEVDAWIDSRPVVDAEGVGADDAAR